jgi:hypothetical protein
VPEPALVTTVVDDDVPTAVARRSVPLPPGTAAALRELAQAPTRAGLKRLLGKPQELVVKLSPSEETLAGLKSGALEWTPSKDGKSLAQVRNVKTKRWVENVGHEPLPDPGRGARSAQVAAGGAAFAWQALAVATQQHYLVEITGQLSGLQSGVEDLVARHHEDRHAELKAIDRALGLVERHIAEGSPLDDGDRRQLRDWHKSAIAIYEAAAEHVRAALGEAARDPMDVLPDLLLADRGACVAARCASALLQVPYATEQQRLIEFMHYAEQTDEAMRAVGALSMAVRTEMVGALDAWDVFEAGRPREIHKRAWNRTGGRVVRRIGPEEPRFDGAKELTEPERLWVLRRADLADAPLEVPAATVVIDGDSAQLLTAPSAEPGAEAPEGVGNG